VIVFAAGVMAVYLASVLTGDAVAQKANEKDRQRVTASDSRFFMLNVLWFKPDVGEKKYKEYLRAAEPIVAKHGGKSNGLYVPETNIIGKFDADLVFFVEWPNQKAFTEFVRDTEYQKVRHLREEAIRDSLLIRCRKK
jgi:uncharacterized protein (DUF1330 family)